MDGFAYPNETEIGWSILIVVYPFITGLVAGAFVMSSLYHVFNIKSLKPVASFSLLMALAFLLVAPMPLQAHLGRPERAFSIFLTPNFTSAMAGFGYIWLGYLVLVLVETWLVFRPDIIRYAETSTGPKRLVYQALTLGVHEIDEKTRRIDEKVIRALAGIGIPAAALLHGYVGFLFGSLKANPWWSTPLMPTIFLMSAIVSGVALLIVMYVGTMKLLARPLDDACLGALVKWLLGFLLVDLALEGLEVLNMVYQAEESWEIISRLITEGIPISYFGIQLFLGSLIPVLLLHAVAGSLVRGEKATWVAFLSALLVLVGVFAMRWNVVIGGQLVSKSLHGLLTYTPTLGGREGVLAAAAIMTLPFYIFSLIVSFLPPWGRPADAEDAVTEEEVRAIPKPAAASVWRLGGGVGGGTPAG